MLALANAKITPKDVLTVGKWADVFQVHTPNEREFLRGIALGAEDYFQESKVSEAGKGSGLQETTEHIFNEAGRKKIEDDVSSFLNFPEDYKAYLIKPGVRKVDAKTLWMKWVFREKFGKKLMMKDDMMKDDKKWVKWQQDLHKSSQSESRSDIETSQSLRSDEETFQVADEIPEVADETSQVADETSQAS